MRGFGQKIGVAFLGVVLATGGLVVGGDVASAVVKSVSGDVVQVAPPASVVPGGFDSTTSISAFNERQGVTLASPLAVDITTPGAYGTGSCPCVHLTTLPSGTVVDSHLIHNDNHTGGTTFRSGDVTFPTDVVGVMINETRLSASDILGAPGTVYPTGNVNRGLELGGTGGDLITLSSDLRTVHVALNTTSSVDQVRVLTRHNSPPVANAGGPYAAQEGSPVTLAATASDPDGNALTSSWSISWTGSAGTSCSATGTATLAPTITCDDNALVTATLSVDDGVNSPVTSVANVTVGNVAPSLGSLTVPGTPTPLAAAVPVGVSFADVGTHDTHTASITWGDTTSSAGPVSETSGHGTVSGSHTYAAPGLYTVTVTVTDDDLGTVSASSQVAVNGPPTADAGGPYNGSEGVAVGLVGTSIDPENDALTTNWAFTPSGMDAGGTCTQTGGNSLIPSLTCTDDAVVAAQLTSSDGINPPVSSSATVTIDNEAPVLGPVTVDAGPIPAGQVVSLAAPFTDAGTNDTHTALVNWGDLTTSAATITESGGSGILSATHTYAHPGAYSIGVVVTDDDLGTDTGAAALIVNSPPTADAGGPYAGTEGAVLALTGTATDVDADALTTNWTFTTTGGAGTVCNASGTTTLNPTLVCNDNAVVQATLTVSDGVNPPVVTTTTIDVGNQPPVLSSLSTPAGPVPLGSAAAVGLTFTDVGTNDTHTATIDWGDATSSSGTIAEGAGLGSVSASHVYATSGMFPVTVTVEDDDHGTAAVSGYVVVNGPPTADAGGPYATSEGTGVVLNGSASDPDDSTLDVGWTFGWTADPGTNCIATGTDTLTPILSCNDNATVTATLTVGDRINPPVVRHATVTVSNVAPAVTAAVPSASPVATGSTVSVGTTFSDVGTNDTHTAVVNWGDSTTTAGMVTESDGGGTVYGEHAYSTSGTFHVTVTVSDDNGGSNAASTDITVNGQPSVGAGGPYTGLEGAGVTLSGTAVDPEADALAVTWTYSVSGADAGTVCTLTDEHSLTPVVTCTDDALVTATLFASDGVNPPVQDSATVDIRNAPPAVSAPIVLPNPAAVGGTVGISTAFTDQGINDDHTAVINWGDSTTSPATVVETLGSGGTAGGSHVYNAPGTYLVKVTVNDKDGGVATATTHVVVSAPPVVDAGGPYHGVEGTPTPLAGTASDPEGDALNLAWTFTWSGPPGTVCSATATGTQSPLVTCNDDAVVTATLTADDGVNLPVSATATLTVGNVVPTIGSVTVPGGTVAVGAPVNLSASFADAGTNDTHTATIAWGDATTSSGSVTETAGVGTVTATHSYPASGTYYVQVTITDDNGGYVTSSATVQVNGAPSIDAGGPYAGVEGSPVMLHATASDPDGDGLGISWTFSWVGGPGTACTAAAVTTLAPSVTCNDDATVTAVLQVSDSVNSAVTSTATVNIANVAPTSGALSVPVAPVPLGSATSVVTHFADAGRNDTHTANISWGDSSTSAGVVTEINGNGSVTGGHVYAGSGTYTISMTILDDNGGAVTTIATTSVVVYDRSQSFVTGGGWIDSPSGASTPGDSSDPDLVGRGNFGFVARYQSPNASVPSGETEFQLRVRKQRSGCSERWDDDRTTSQALDFHSTGYVWLVVDAARTKAYYRGTGTVNGVSGYEFVVSVIDGRSSSTPDRFRIKVWKTSTGAVLYDSQPGAPDDASATTAIGGGSIVIH